MTLTEMEHIHDVFKNKTQHYKSQYSPSYSANWWGHIWKGLLAEHTAKHYKAMGRAVWLYLYLIVHANRTTGILFRKTITIAVDMGIPIRTIQHWLNLLRKHNYVLTQSTGRSLIITITKWRPIIKRKN